ncbi:hypothetical protein [Methylobacterium indicum]|uniref:Uncharacterized protein n=1 Tax=Methylobacterium indicum TaxID=1775910 RepID=A0A8H8X0H7_9HYPH|nr:hypothetical protein [Methylobacterium indicum]BCM87794.1 hypothetical protein mvi_62550 [Methylobacterium indicum]
MTSFIQNAEIIRLQAENSRLLAEREPLVRQASENAAAADRYKAISINLLIVLRETAAALADSTAEVSRLRAGATPEMRLAADKARSAHLCDIDANDQIGALNAALDAALEVRLNP